MVSQSNEDAIIDDIFQKVGPGRKRFIEFGCGDGRQNNTIELLKRGWSGLWFEPHRRRCISAQDRWLNYPVVIKRLVITPRNVNKNVTGHVDFLSIDIDGNDYAVWEALTVRPRVVCIEVGDERGTPLGPMTDLATSNGYRLVTVSQSGVNAFYVSKELHA